MSENAPQFVRFVSAVKGRLATRWGSRAFFGATLSSPDDVRLKGVAPVIWDLERVYGLTDDFCRQFSRELGQSIAHGDLKERNKEEFEAYEKAKAEAREKRKKDREEAAAKAEAEARDAEKAASDESDEANSGAGTNEDSGNQDSAPDVDDGSSEPSESKPSKGGRSKK